MNTFRCSNCGFQIQRPTQPFSCPQCGRQAVGLFRLVSFTPPAQGIWPGQPAQPGMQPGPPQGMPQQPGWPQQPAMPQQPGVMQPGIPQAVPGGWPAPPQAPQQPANPWGQPPGGQPMPQQSMPQKPAVGGWPGQPGMAQQPGAPQQGWPQQPQMPQQPMNPWGQQPGMTPMPQQPAGGWPGQTAYPQQGLPQQPSMPQQPGSLQPPAGWPGAIQQPSPAPWTGQPPVGQPGVPQTQGYTPGIPLRYPQPPFPVAPQTQPPAQGMQPPVQAPEIPPGPPPPRNPPAPPRQSPPGVPPVQKGSPPGRTAFPAPPGAAKRSAPPAQSPPAAPSAGLPDSRQTPAPPARPPVSPEGRQPESERSRLVPPSEPAKPASKAANPTVERAATKERPRTAPAPQPPTARSSKPSTAKPQAVEAPKPAPRPKAPRPQNFVWSFPEDLLPEEQATAIRNAPAVDSAGRIFLQYRDRLVALVEEDKKPKLLWEYTIGSRAPGPAVLGPQDTLLLHCCDGYLHCLDAASGKQIWSPAGVGEPLGYAVPVVDRGGNTWVSSPTGGLHRVDAGGQIQKPQFFRSRQKFDSPALAADGVLYVASELGYMFAIDLQEDRGVNKWSHAGDQAYVGVVRSAPLRTADGTLVVAGQDDCLYGVAAIGAITWKTQMPGQILGSPVADRHGHIYLGLSQAPRGMDPHGLLVCIDGNSHKVRWEYRTTAAVESSPVIGDDDLIYFGDNSGVIHAVNFFGKAQWTADVGSPVRSAGTLLAPQRLAFGLDEESLVVLECSSSGLAAECWPKVGRTLGQNGMG